MTNERVTVARPPQDSLTDGYTKAVLNILEDFSAETGGLEDTQKAILNILEDVAAEEKELAATQKAVLNILEDVDAERNNVNRVNRTLEQEIAERIRIEQALRHASIYVRNLLEASLDPMVTIGPDGTITDVNAATEAVTGRTRAELTGTDFSDYFTDPPAAKKGYESAFRHGFVRDYPLQIRHTNGNTTPVLYNASVYRDEAGEVVGVFAAARDISALARAQDELRMLNQQLIKTLSELRATQQQVIQSEKLSAIGTMAAGVAHELNNPLMGVINYVANARRAAREPAVAQRLERADRELQRMRQILHNLLTFARPVTEDIAQSDVAKIFLRSAELLEPELKTRGISLILRFDQPLPKVRTKETHLQQVFVNLLLNARDTLEQSEKKVIEVAITKRDGWLDVTIADTGPGIPMAIQSRIFDPFFTTKPPGKGTGLGLSISRNIVQDIGGHLTFESEPGHGTRFTVALPIGGDYDDSLVR